jgi:hypothetical protein
MQTLTDYQGREIRLTDERLRHIFEHREMAGMESALKQTLREPEIVRRSRTDNTAMLNYRRYSGTRFGDKWLCVIVKYTEDPFVLTAYLTDAVKQGEELWRKK